MENPSKINREPFCTMNTGLIGQQDEWPAADLLKLYKSQIGIEKNFSFLKDPAVVNSIFLKKAERIEDPGFILLISLPTKKTTSFMMTRHMKIFT